MIAICIPIRDICTYVRRLVPKHCHSFAKSAIKRYENFANLADNTSFSILLS
jgi:hypothetical protein